MEEQERGQVRIEVEDGTGVDQFLCKNCKHAHIIKGRNDFETQVRCGYSDSGTGSFLVTIMVTDCNNHEEFEPSDLRSYRNKLERDAVYIEKLASGKIVLLTFEQVEDYAYMEGLRSADRKLANKKPWFQK